MKFKEIRRNIVKVWDKYPFLQWNMHNSTVCIIFMEYLNNSDALRYFLTKQFGDKRPTKLIKDIKLNDNIQQNVVPFLLQCYNDLKIVLDKLWNYQHNFVIIVFLFLSLSFEE